MNSYLTIQLTCTILYTAFRNCEVQQRKGRHIFHPHRIGPKVHRKVRSDPPGNGLVHPAFLAYCVQCDVVK